jgi:hypothetical protein
MTEENVQVSFDTDAIVAESARSSPSMPRNTTVTASSSRATTLIFEDVTCSRRSCRGSSAAQEWGTAVLQCTGLPSGMMVDVVELALQPNGLGPVVAVEARDDPSVSDAKYCQRRRYPPRLSRSSRGHHDPNLACQGLPGPGRSFERTLWLSPWDLRSNHCRSCASCELPAASGACPRWDRRSRRAREAVSHDPSTRTTGAGNDGSRRGRCPRSRRNLHRSRACATRPAARCHPRSPAPGCADVRGRSRTRDLPRR